jgi:hypothetical protein
MIGRGILCLCLLLSLVAPVLSEGTVGAELVVGKNNVSVSEFFYPVYVGDLVANNPQIQSVTLVEGGVRLAYVNVFGGIGQNFLFESGKLYEVHVSSAGNITIR